MQCPFCSNKADTKVIDSRLVKESHQIRRRRECICCAARFTTYEMVELSLPRLIKQDGRCVQFEEAKLRSGILRALEKRSVRLEQIDTMIQKIITRLRSCGEREISTRQLGEWVMAELSKLDEVAYVRFASVYRRFENIEAFIDEIALLKKQEVTTL